MCVGVYLGVFVCMHVCLVVSVCVCACVCVRACACVRAGGGGGRAWGCLGVGGRI